MASPSPSLKDWKREVAVAASLLAFGLFVLPIAIYTVGRQLIGAYGETDSMWDLAEIIWADLLTLEPPAWILVLSPYIVVQLLRWVWRLWRR